MFFFQEGGEPEPEPEVGLEGGRSWHRFSFFGRGMVFFSEGGRPFTSGGVERVRERLPTVDEVVKIGRIVQKEECTRRR